MPQKLEFALAVDIGGTKAEAALVDRAGMVLSGSRVRRSTGPGVTREVLQQLVSEIALDAANSLTPEMTLVGVGVGSAGPLDLERRSVAPLNMPLATGATFDFLADVVDAPISLALDGTCVALAEHRFGAARGHGTVLALVVSTGVGGGVIIDGRPITGRSGNAGHVGQMRIERRGGGSPHAGTVEHLASGPRAVEWAQERGWTGSTGQDLARAYAAGEPVARAAVERSAAAIGSAVASVSTLLDLEVAVIAGGFVQVADDYVDLVAAAVRDESLLPHTADIIISGTGLAGSGPLVGAAALAFDAYDGHHVPNRTIGESRLVSP
ncbi:glucokinase [Microbacterium sp. BE35]|uniref:ROK family protein n=1 Tax=Microbacterium sp. BE35 TaxID=2817773 RepID=UPI002860D342|nr:ROK family protein [Microbacterium sp. BE35]MDR7188267.1 glucokinase [Microbacterium sp. BE35]